MIRRTRAFAAALALLAGSLSAATAAAEPPPAWPVRLNLSFPLGYTFGGARLHGFTWGLRGSVDAHPTSSGRGTGIGLFGEALLDERTDSIWTLGGSVTAPVVRADWLDLRVGGLAGWTSQGAGSSGGSGLELGALTSVALPAYFYDFRIGVRVSGVFADEGLSSLSVLLDLDLVGLLGALGWAFSTR